MSKNVLGVTVGLSWGKSYPDDSGSYLLTFLPAAGTSGKNWPIKNED